MKQETFYRVDRFVSNVIGKRRSTDYGYVSYFADEIQSEDK